MVKHGEERDHFELKFLVSIMSLSPLVDHLIVDLPILWWFYPWLLHKLYRLRLNREELWALLEYLCNFCLCWNRSVTILIENLMFKTLVYLLIKEFDTLYLFIFEEVEQLIFVYLSQLLFTTLNSLLFGT